MMMYPLLLTPAMKDYLWGGTRLKSEFGYACKSATAAEAWVLSCHKDGPSVVSNGEHKGKTLPEVLKLWGGPALGEKAAAFPYFPLLIKLIDARDRLSVQVHPDDEYAMRVEGEFGKTEMWYVVDCEPGAQLIYGLRESVTKTAFRQYIRDNRLTDICNLVPVHKGDVFFIQSGTLHAIGAGILIAEVQQNSNTTYRVSDYGRLGKDGKPRPLHIDKAVDVTALTPPTEAYGNVGETVGIQGGTSRRLADCPLFSARLLEVTGSVPVGYADSFSSLICLEGRCTLTWDGGEPLTVEKGSSLFLPAGTSANLTAAQNQPAQLLCSRL